jgi:hypothetical protein
MQNKKNFLFIQIKHPIKQRKRESNYRSQIESVLEFNFLIKASPEFSCIPGKVPDSQTLKVSQRFDFFLNHNIFKT